jgi:hypothetical protein
MDQAEIEARAKAQRYGILKVKGGIDGVEIDYFDRQLRTEGSLNLGRHQVPSNCWPALNEALNAIIASQGVVASSTSWTL